MTSVVGVLFVGNYFRIRINDFCAQGGGKTMDCVVNLLDLAGDVAGGGGDCDDA
jgi:hypothetical protein